MFRDGDPKSWRIFPNDVFAEVLGLPTIWVPLTLVVRNMLRIAYIGSNYFKRIVPDDWPLVGPWLRRRLIAQHRLMPPNNSDPKEENRYV